VSISFGSHDHSSGSSSQVEPGMYDATIDSVSLVKDASGLPMVDQYGKEKAQVKFETTEGPLSRRYTISFGKNNQTGQYAAFAKFIEAATGIKCGDNRQRQVTDSELVGKRVRIVADLSDDGKYTNVTNVMPPARVSKPVQHDTAFGDEGLPPEPDEAPF